MNLLRATNSVPFASRDIAPTTGTPQYATSGNPVGPVPATTCPAYLTNMMMTEIINLITAYGLTLDDTDWGQLSKAAQLVGKQGQKLTGSGNFTVPAGIYALDVELWGGGGGSTGGTAGSGGGGGYERGLLAVTPGQVIAYVCGAAGLGSGTIGSATGGGTTTFSTIQATGGAPGGTGPGAGGIGSGGLYSMQGGGGTDLDGTATVVKGGDAPRGGFGGSVNNAGGVTAATAPGGGGGANAAAAGDGSNGAVGWIIVRW